VFLQVYGLGTGPKTDVLADLIAEHPGAEIHFVEDRVETLEGKKSFLPYPPPYSHTCTIIHDLSNQCPCK
jgi:hypothetical protein